MSGQAPGSSSHPEIIGNSVDSNAILDQQSFVRKWYFSKEEIECDSPSRKDGIKYSEELHLSKLYCSYIQELGMDLKVPQVTIATATVFCHRFYMRQSHAKNHWQTVAAACLFLASKSEETPRCLNDLVLVAYTLMYKWDPLAPKRIREKKIFDKQKQVILLAESLLLATLAFDLNVEHPYKSLVAAVKVLGLPHKDLMKVAWNFVNDWIRTTLCLQYKPHCIAAGSLFLAAKLQKVKLPSTKGKLWWMQFDVSPKQLEEVIQQMLKVLDQNKKQTSQTKAPKAPESKHAQDTVTQSSPESCISNGSSVTEESGIAAPAETQDASHGALSPCSQKKHALYLCDNTKTEHSRTSDCGSTNNLGEDVVFQPKGEESDQSCKINVYQIRERLKKRKVDRQPEKSFIDGGVPDDMDTWIERELESGIQKPHFSPEKRNMMEMQEIVE